MVTATLGVGLMVSIKTNHTYDLCHTYSTPRHNLNRNVYVYFTKDMPQISHYLVVQNVISTVFHQQRSTELTVLHSLIEYSAAAISTSVLQEFLKHAMPDTRSGALTCFPLDCPVKSDNVQPENSLPVGMPCVDT